MSILASSGFGSLDLTVRLLSADESCSQKLAVALQIRDKAVGSVKSNLRAELGIEDELTHDGRVSLLTMNKMRWAQFLFEFGCECRKFKVQSWRQKSS